MKRAGILTAIFLTGALFFLFLPEKPSVSPKAQQALPRPVRPEITHEDRTQGLRPENPPERSTKTKTCIQPKFLGPWLLSSQRVVFRHTTFNASEAPDMSSTAITPARSVIS